MRLKQNLTLVILILILLSAIFSINTLNIISIPTNKNNTSDKEVKVSNNQLPYFKEKVNIEIIWDISGSMWGKIESKNKINTSKEILKKIVNDLPDKVYLGLRVFGRKKFKEEESFLAISIAKNNKNQLLNFIEKIKPAGKSPIGLNLIKAGEDLKTMTGKKHILLVTDGKDTGEIMPSKIIENLNKKNIRTHIIQVGKINKINQLQLKSLAELGNGKYFTYFENENVVPTINLN